jgi:hypothetical protein
MELLLFYDADDGGRMPLVRSWALSSGLTKTTGLAASGMVNATCPQHTNTLRFTGRLS